LELTVINASLFAAGDANAVIDGLRHLPLETVLLPVLWQLALIVLVARVFFVLFRKVKQPGVIGEIAAGIVLGPSVLGYFFPGMFAAIFHPVPTGVDPQLFDALLNGVFSVTAQLGLIFLLFLIGLEFDFSHLRFSGKAAPAISAAGVAAPFALGLALAPVIYPLVAGQSGSDDPAGQIHKLGFALFLGTALSITAIPVLGRIMVELGITRTRLGAITIASAAVDDATGWILLASVAAVVNGQFQIGSMSRMIGLTVLFAATMIFVARPLFSRWARAVMRRGQGEIGLSDLAVLIVCVLLCAIATNLIGIFAIFGAFFFGAILSGEREFSAAVLRRMGDFMTVLFLPIFFTYTGLRTEIGSLDTIQLWLIFLVILLAAVLGKWAGCGLAAWLTGSTPREASCIGVMMNTRGLMELIVINVGFELHVIPKSVYCMLVLVALVTNIITTPVLIWLSRGTELEPAIAIASRRQISEDDLPDVRPETEMLSR
jgi:Kef-type K+ transport system membrane component KefB